MYLFICSCVHWELADLQPRGGGQDEYDMASDFKGFGVQGTKTYVDSFSFLPQELCDRSMCNVFGVSALDRECKDSLAVGGYLELALI